MPQESLGGLIIEGIPLYEASPYRLGEVAAHTDAQTSAKNHNSHKEAGEHD